MLSFLSVEAFPSNFNEMMALMLSDSTHLTEKQDRWWWYAHQNCVFLDKECGESGNFLFFVHELVNISVFGHGSLLWSIFSGNYHNLIMVVLSMIKSLKRNFFFFQWIKPALPVWQRCDQYQSCMYSLVKLMIVGFIKPSEIWHNLGGQKKWIKIEGKQE